MVVIAGGALAPFESETLRLMFEARKRVFVDLLKWNVPVVAGQYELDQFDDEHAVYLIIADKSGRHLGSARLLKSLRPHILDTLFPELCASEPPRGANILEITRFCLDRNQSSVRRLETRNTLVSALVDYGLANGVATYTGVAELTWLQQILSFGWRCRPLGIPQIIEGKALGALRIEIAGDTPALLAASGIYARSDLEPIHGREAA